MNIYCQNHPKFNYSEAKKLYDECKSKIESEDDFNEVLKDTHFYSFFIDGKFIGCIYLYLIDDKVFMNGFASRGHHLGNIEAIKKTIDSYNCDIYAKSHQKPAILCLLRCGFKKIDNNLYKYERKK